MRIEWNDTCKSPLKITENYPNGALNVLMGSCLVVKENPRLTIQSLILSLPGSAGWSFRGASPWDTATEQAVTHV